LKEIASKLGINYSSAKTIVQTFRKERRFTKKEKKQINTINSMKKQKILQKALNSEKCLDLFSKIMDDYTFGNLCMKNDPKDKEFPLSNSICASTTNYSNNLSGNRSEFSRIASAESMQNLISDTSNSLNSVSVGVNTELDLIEHQASKDVFFVHDSDENFPENFELDCKYNNLLMIPKKRKLLPSLSKDNFWLLNKENPELLKNIEFETFINFNFYRFKIWSSFLEYQIGLNRAKSIINGNLN